MKAPSLYDHDVPHLSDEELHQAVHGAPREADYGASIALIREWIARGLDG